MDDTNTLNVHIHALRQELAKHASSETPTIKNRLGLGLQNWRKHEVVNEIKSYILVGISFSTLLTIIVVFLGHSKC